MQDNLMQAQTQPFVKLVQASGSAMKLMQSGAFAHMLQGMLKNYTEFLGELGQSGMALITQGQAAMARQMQEATDGGIDLIGQRGAADGRRSASG